jgi:hypothetical protein
MRKLIETVGSGDQLVTEDNHRDRVHGVNHEHPDVVLVTSDRRRDVPYPRGTLVDVV